jgi:hypothetical protein
MLYGKCIACAFGGNGLNRGIIDLRVHRMQAAETINKDCGAPVALLGKFPFQLCKNPSSVHVIWSAETRSPGLVATKTL